MASPGLSAAQQVREDTWTNCPLPSSQHLMCNIAPSGTSASGHFTLASFLGLVIIQNFSLQHYITVPLKLNVRVWKIFIALKLYRVVSKNETFGSKLGVYICCVPDPYLRKNLVSSMGNLNSSLCYQTRVKLQRFAPLLAGADMRWWTTGRCQ